MAEQADVFEDVKDHSKAAMRAWAGSVKALIPAGFLEKTKEGNREALLAVRSLLDVAIDKLEDEPEGKASGKKKQKVKVEVE